MGRLLVAAGVFVVAFGVYAATLTPTIGLVDSGALTVAAHSLGNAHPPGFPLYLLLTHLFTMLPFGSVAVRANMASAFFGALSCAMVALAVAEIVLTPAPTTKKGQVEPPPSPLPLYLTMAFGGLLLAFSRTLWAYATVAEVYALNTFLLTAILWLMLSWRRTREPRRLVLAAALFGLALGVHHVTIGLTLLGIAALVLQTEKLAFFRTKTFALAAVVSIAALLAIYAYLPLRAAQDPPLNWGDPDTMQRVVDHITAKQYRSYVNTESQGKQVDAVIAYTTRELGPRWFPIALLLGIYGFYAAWRRDRGLFWLLLLMIVAIGAWMLVYPIVNDQDAYLLPAFVALVLAASFGAATLARGRVAILAALLILPLLAVGVHWRYRDRSDFTVAKDYVDNTLRGIEPNSLLITDDWQLWAPLFYFREAEGLRRDVIPIEYGMLIRSWYLRQLEHEHPELMGSVQKELDAYRPLLEISENQRERFDANVERDFNNRLDDLVMAMIQSKVASGGHSYATYEVVLSRDLVDANLVQRIATAYDAVPRGVALELMPGHQRREVSVTPLELRGLIDGAIPYEPDDVVLTEILPSYQMVTLVRARYLALSRKFEEALREYETALSLNPGNTMIVREIQRVQMARGASPGGQ